MQIVEHIAMGSLGLAAILQCIALLVSNGGLYLGGSGIALTGAVGVGVYWLLQATERDIFKVLLVMSQILYWLFVLLLFFSPRAMTVLIWMTSILGGPSLWLTQTLSLFGFWGVVLGQLLLDIGYTLAAKNSTGGSIAMLVLGTGVVMVSFYRERLVWNSKPRDVDTSVVVVSYESIHV